jgi:predicted transcriptional regulator
VRNDKGMKYRDRNEIIAQILETANGNRVRLTKIMYDVFLSHTLTKEYVRLLIEKGLIEYLDGERTFKTTDKGMDFLRIHNRVQELSPLTTKFGRSTTKLQSGGRGDFISLILRPR